MYMKKITSIFAVLLTLLAWSNSAQAQCGAGQTSCKVTVTAYDDSYNYDGWYDYSLSFYQGGNLLGSITVGEEDEEEDLELSVCTGAGAAPVVMVLNKEDEDGFYYYDLYDMYVAIFNNFGEEILPRQSLMVDYYNYPYPGDTVFEWQPYCATCAVPSVSLISNSSDGLTFEITEKGDATTWFYAVTESEDAPTTWSTTTSTTVSVSDLDALTTYYIQVRSYCGEGDTSSIVSISAYTLADRINSLSQLPMTEDFEGYGYGSSYVGVPAAWEAIEYGLTSYGTIYPYLYNYSSHSGGRSLYFYTWYGNNAIASPWIDLDASDIELVLWSNYDDSGLEVGYTLSGDGSDFELVSAITGSSQWAPATVSFADAGIASGTSFRIIVRASDNSNGSISGYIDDLTIRQAAACPSYTGDITWNTSVMADGEVSLQWDEVEGVSSWEVAYGSNGFDPDGDDATIATTNTNGIVVEGLTNGQIYQFYVRANCTGKAYWNDYPVLAAPMAAVLTAGKTDTVTGCGITIFSDGMGAGDKTYSTTRLVVRSDDPDNGIHLEGICNPAYNATLNIYDGEGTSGVLLGSYTYYDSVIVSSMSNALTLVYTTGNSVGEGFEVEASCFVLPSCFNPVISEVTVSGNSVDVMWNYPTTNNEPNGFQITYTNTETGEVAATDYVEGNVRMHSQGDLEQKVSYRVSVEVDCDDEMEPAVAEFTTSCVNGGDVFVGNEKSTSYSYSIPIEFYNYNDYQKYSQSIYLAEELSEVTDTVTGLSLFVQGGEYDVDFDLYISHTNVEKFSDGGSPIEIDTADLVYSGTYSFQIGENYIPFSKVFMYDGESNIVMTIVSKETYFYNDVYFYYTSASSGILGYGDAAYDNDNADYYEIDPSDINTMGYLSTSSNRANVKFATPCGDPSCAKAVGVKAENVEAYTATITWKEHGDDTWNVDYRPLGSTAWINAVSGTSATSCDLSDLQPGTNYEVRVSTICASKNAERTAEFATLCAAVSVPFTENFDNFTAAQSTDDFQNCWMRIAPEGAYSKYPYKYQNALYFYPTTQYQSGKVITPEFEDDLNTLEVAFNASDYYGTYGVGVEVGVYEDDGTCVPVDSILIEPSGSYRYTYEFQSYAVSLENYEGTGKRIYLRGIPVLSEYAYDYILVDDLEVNTIPSCKRLAGANVTGATENSIIIAVNDPYNRGNYQVLINTENESATATVATSSYSDGAITVSGLSSNTTYYLWVRAVCSSTDQSPLYSVGSAVTNCDVVAVTDANPYELTFDETEEVECVRLYMMENTRSYNCSLSSSNAVSTPYSLEAYGSNSRERRGIYVVMPAFNFSGLSTDAEISFKTRYDKSTWDPENHDLHIEVVGRKNVNDSWNVIYTCDSTNFTAWNTYFVDLPSTKGASYYEVAFRISDTAGYAKLYVDDVRVGARTECRPSDFTISNITEHEATVSWEADGVATHRVQYRRKGALNWSSIMAENGATSVVISPLYQDVDYQVRINAVCDNVAEPVMSSPKAFSTPTCNSTVEKDNYTANMAAITDNADILVKQTATTNSFTYTEVLVEKADIVGLNDIVRLAIHAENAGNESSIPNATIYMRHSNLTQLTNSFNFDEMKMVKVYSGAINSTAEGWIDLKLSTPFEWNGDSNIIVGFMFQQRYAGTYYPYVYVTGHSATKNMRATYSQDKVITKKKLGKLTASDIAVSADVPNLRLISCEPICYEPTIRRTSSDATTVTVDWIQEGNTIEASIAEVGSTDWSAPKLVTGEHKVTFDQLNSNSEYQVRLRANCTDKGGDYSDYVMAIVKTDTACTIPDQITISDVHATNATINWIGDEVANRWEVNVYNSGYDTTYEVSAHPFVAKDLVPGNSYYVKVRAYCGASDHVVGEWSDPKPFQNTCYPAKGVTASVLGNGDVKVDWSAGERNTKWIVAWGIKGQDLNHQLRYVEVSTETYTIPAADIKSGSTYTIHVRAICEEGWNSVWSDGVNVNLTGGEGIDDVEANAHFTLQPNPATDRVVLNLESFEGQADVRIVSVDGREVSQFSTTESNTTINLQGYAAGTYFVKVQTADWSSVRKLVVK